jgi:hypothetical protein
MLGHRGRLWWPGAQTLALKCQVWPCSAGGQLKMPPRESGTHHLAWVLTIGDFHAAGGDDQSLGTRAQLFSCVFLCSPGTVDSIFNGLASYFPLGVDALCGSGVWKSA